jgi:hypothetical protein
LIDRTIKNKKIQELALSTQRRLNQKHDIITMTKILLVDDEPDVPYTIKNILEDNGFAVNTFNDLILALNCTMRNLEKLD